MTTVQDNVATIFGSTPSETLLSELSVDRFASKAWKELESFLAAVRRTELPFDLLAQLRRHEYPPYPGYESGMPNVYYYFVPKSGWGSEWPFPADALNPAFVRSMDGFGLNFGCPLRLKRAIEILEELPPDDQRSCRDGLASATKHLSTIEELLWFDPWNSPIQKRHIRETTRKSYDWSIAFSNTSLRLECKFRPSDWPRLIDGDIHVPIAGSLTRKAAEQLGKPGPNEINVLAVTGVAAMTKRFQEFCRAELGSTRNVQAIVYRSFVGETSVLSLDQSIATAVAAKIPAHEAQPFQLFYFMFTHRAEAARRRQRTRIALSGSPVSKVTRIDVPSLPPRKVLLEPPLPYRCNLVQRLADGEPLFEHVPPYVRV